MLALLLINELRKMFGTVLEENCFVPENVASLRRMGDLLFHRGHERCEMCGVPDHCHAGDHFGIFIAGMFSKVIGDGI